MTDLKKTMFAILSGEISLKSAVEDMTNDECQDLFKSLELLNKAKFISPADQKKSRLKAQRNANIDAKQEMADEDAEAATPQPGSSDFDKYRDHAEQARKIMGQAVRNEDHPLHAEVKAEGPTWAKRRATETYQKATGKKTGSHLNVIKAEEVLKIDSNGQWSVAKAGDGASGTIGSKPKKPAAPTLDYGKMNAKPNYKDIEAKAPTLDYGKMNAKPDYKDIESKASTLDYGKMNAKPNYKDIEAKADTIDYSDKRNVQVKKPWAGAAAQRDKARAKIDAASKQTAVEHLAEKRSTRKRFGI